MSPPLTAEQSTEKAKYLTLEEFLNLPEGDITYELQAGQAIAKISPKRIHSRLQPVLWSILEDWGSSTDSVHQGFAYTEWAICLQREDEDWCPVPDVTYISDGKLADLDLANEACPVPPELVIEILSPSQSLEEMTRKALDYLAAGVQRVWLISDRHRSLTVFAPETPPMTYQGDQPIQDELFPQLAFTVNELFRKAKV
jgi:Uma2 family endonuclease